MVLGLKEKERKGGGGGALSIPEETSLQDVDFGRFYKYSISCPESSCYPPRIAAR
jgi:hypothetical protein